MVKKILTSVEPIIQKSTPVLQNIYNSIKEVIENIITPPKAGNETTPLKEPLLKSNTELFIPTISKTIDIL